MKLKQEEKQIIYQIIWNGMIDEPKWYFNRDGEAQSFMDIEVLSTVIQRIICTSIKTMEELVELSHGYPLEEMNFFALHKFLREAGCQLKAEPIFHKGAIYHRINQKRKKTENIILLNSEYEKDTTAYSNTYVIARVGMDEYGNYVLDDMEDNVEILHRAFKYEYILEYEFIDSDTFCYDFYTGEIKMN